MRTQDKRSVMYNFALMLALCIGIHRGWFIASLFIIVASLFASYAAIEIMLDSPKFWEFIERILDRPKWRVQLNRIWDVPVLVMLVREEWWMTLCIFLAHVVLTIAAEEVLWKREKDVYS